jgi:hypothetical protein
MLVCRQRWPGGACTGGQLALGQAGLVTSSCQQVCGLHWLLQRCIYFDTLTHAVVRRRAARCGIAGAAIRAYCSGWPLTEQVGGVHRERGSLGAGPGPASVEARGDTPEPGSHEHRAGSRPAPGKSRGPGGRAESGCVDPLPLLPSGLQDDRRAPVGIDGTLSFAVARRRAAAPGTAALRVVTTFPAMKANSTVGPRTVDMSAADTRGETHFATPGQSSLS